VQNQWKIKWPYIENAAFRIVQNDGEQGYCRRFQGGNRPPLDPTLGYSNGGSKK